MQTLIRGNLHWNWVNEWFRNSLTFYGTKSNWTNPQVIVTFNTLLLMLCSEWLPEVWNLYTSPDAGFLLQCWSARFTAADFTSRCFFFYTGVFFLHFCLLHIQLDDAQVIDLAIAEYFTSLPFLNCFLKYTSTHCPSALWSSIQWVFKHVAKCLQIISPCTLQNSFCCFGQQSHHQELEIQFHWQL